MHSERIKYREGGFHPVHLRDTFNNERYTVLHKLGQGGFATVWLARDSTRNRYVALKMLASRLSSESPEVKFLRRIRNWDGSTENETEAESDAVKQEAQPDEKTEKDKAEAKAQPGREYVMSMLDHFWIEGPNGRHLCVVSEVAGPSIKQFNECPGLRMGSRRLRADLARRVSLQAVQGLAFIHSTGTVHGDFTAANILLRLANIDEWTEEQIYERLGQPQMEETRDSGHSAKRSEPNYIVEAINMKVVDPKWLADKIMIIDFGLAFLIEQSSEDIGTPKNYRAPEFNFDIPRSVHSDIWALGCTIFEIRTGSSLFRHGSSPTRDQILIEMVKTLGSLPNVWWSSWEKGTNWYEIESMEGGQLASKPNGLLHSLIMEIGLHDGEKKLKIGTYEDMGFAADNNDAEHRRLTSSSEGGSRGYSRRLVDLVDELTSSEALEVLALITNKLSSSSSGAKASDSGAKSASSSGSKNAQKDSLSELSSGKAAEKSMSSEGISTALPSGQPQGAGSAPTPGSAQTSPEPTADFLETYGTVITSREAEDLESLLRSALAFLPQERASATALAEHPWFTENYMTMSGT